jgi:hypothetical protein
VKIISVKKIQQNSQRITITERHPEIHQFTRNSMTSFPQPNNTFAANIHHNRFLCYNFFGFPIGFSSTFFSKNMSNSCIDWEE